MENKPTDKGEWVSVEDLDFKKMSHISYTNCYVTERKDAATEIWEIAIVKRTNGGYGLGASKTEYYIGNHKKKYKSLEEVVAAYNSSLTPK